MGEALDTNRRRIAPDLGRWLDDFVVGDVYVHRPGRTITETDNTWFTLLTMNTHPLHFDREYAQNTEHGALVVNSALTLAIVTGMKADGTVFMEFERSVLIPRAGATAQ